MWAEVRLSIGLAFAAAACGQAAPSSPAYDRYLASQRSYIVEVSKRPQLAAELPRAKAIVAGMSAASIARLEALGYPLLVAADEEAATRGFWPTTGTDWTLYALPHGCCRSPAQSKALLRRSGAGICRDTVFRVVGGSVARAGRATQPGRSYGVGIIPFGIDDYRGVLTTDTHERLPVVWERGWSGMQGNRLADDPLDDQIHRFALRRLAGAHYWTVVTWFGRPAAPSSGLPTDRRSCLAASLGAPA